jgi:hypothetical protein
MYQLKAVLSVAVIVWVFGTLSCAIIRDARYQRVTFWLCARWPIALLQSIARRLEGDHE